MAASVCLRREVLKLYRHILRVSQSWQATSETHTSEERDYIASEAKTLFRRNKHISNPAEIRLCLGEAKSRLDMAFHYKNPYPRPVNVPPSYVSSSKSKRAQVRRTRESKPLYVHSQDQ